MRVLAILGVLSVPACRYFNTYAEIENLSSTTISSAELVLEENEPVVIKLDPIAPQMTRRVRLPSGFGESTLRFRAVVDGVQLNADCGYLESDGYYVARIKVGTALVAECNVGVS